MRGILFVILLSVHIEIVILNAIYDVFCLDEAGPLTVEGDRSYL